MNRLVTASLLICLSANALAQTTWFHGSDNFQIRLTHSGDSVKVADYFLRDPSSWTEPPKDRRDILKPADLGVAWSLPSAGNSDYDVTLEIPRNDKYGLKLVRGKKFSVRIGLQTSTDLWVWNELFERKGVKAQRMTFQSIRSMPSSLRSMSCGGIWTPQSIPHPPLCNLKYLLPLRIICGEAGTSSSHCSRPNTSSPSDSMPARPTSE